MTVEQIIKAQGLTFPPVGQIQPFVSVLCVVDDYSTLTQITESFASLISQSFDCFEACVINASHLTAVSSYLETLSKDDNRFHVQTVSAEQKNIAILYYMAYRMCSGVYIAFLPMQVVWNQDFLRDIRTYLISREEKAAFGTILYRTNLLCAQYGTQATNIQDLRITNVLSEGSVMLHRSVIENIGFLCPHTVMQGFCFHDFYYRISRKYVIGFADVICGSGLAPDETTKPYDASLQPHTAGWVRNECLSLGIGEQTIDQYPHFDTEMLPEAASQLLKDVTGESEKRIDRSKKRILVMVPLMFASVTLYFERVRLPIDSFDIRFVASSSLSENDLFLCDYLIVVRDLFDTEPIVRQAIKLGIVCFYFVDDNFQELHNEHPEYAVFAHYDISSTRSALKKYSAVLCSTQALVDYYIQKRLHSNVLLFEPIVGTWFASRQKSEIVTIAYMGGLSRKEQVDRCLLPALQTVSKEIPIRFICPQFVDSERYQSENLEIYTVPFMESLDQTILRFGRYPIDIQAHCAIQTKNNIYKTTNALMNSAQIGAALIASNCDPFDKLPQDRHVCMLADDNESSWAEAILELASNSDRREQLISTARMYCADKWSGTENTDSMLELLERFPNNKSFIVPEAFDPSDTGTQGDVPSEPQKDMKARDECFQTGTEAPNKRFQMDMAAPDKRFAVHHYSMQDLLLQYHSIRQRLVAYVAPNDGILFAVGEKKNIIIDTVAIAIAKYNRVINGTARIMVFSYGQLIMGAEADVGSVPDNGLMVFSFSAPILINSTTTCRVEFSKECEAVGVYGYRTGFAGKIFCKLTKKLKPYYFILQ